MSKITSKKFFMSTALAAMVCLSACTHDEIENDETVSETAGITSAAVSAIDGESAETAVNNYSDEDILRLLREYFKDRDGFSGRYIEDEYSYELTVDISKCSDPDEIFSGLDSEFLTYIRYLRIAGLQNEDISFVNKLTNATVIIDDYSGNADFSVYEDDWRIIFDNYKGGSLSTVKTKSIQLDSYSGEYPLNGLAETEIENFFCNYYSPNVDFSVLKDCPNIKFVWLRGGILDAEVFADVLKNSGIEQLTAEVTNYYEAEGDTLMKAAPTKKISYGMYTEATDREKLHDGGLALCTNVEVIPNFPEENMTDVWTHRSSLVCRLFNYTDEAKTAERVFIYKDNSVGVARSFSDPMTFTNGETEYPINFTVNAGESANLDINGEIFDFAACEPGTYKVIFDFGNRTLEQIFFIGLDYAGDNYWDFWETSEGSNTYELKPSFMNAEQQEVFSKAYSVTRDWFWCSCYLPEEEAAKLTADEFLAPIREVFTEDYTMQKTLGFYINEETGELQAASRDGGTNPEYQDGLFFPVYSDENELIFKVIEIHAHDGDPFRVWPEEENFHMVNTENGWRFDKFDLWY
ncbi:MAG: hypothetical protein K2K34_08965 [Oscillospiraceae bacterium]|nr:hypothetical protein [Oscillospiraceae bacterium]